MAPIVYIRASCQQPLLSVPGTSLQIERQTLAIVVVSFDVAIVISFLLSFYFLAYFENSDRRDIDRDNLTTEDFSLVFKNLPKPSAYNTIPELKAALWNHIETIVKNEP
jgi:hypothetical protein